MALGDIVLYTLRAGVTRAAIVTRAIDATTACLHVLQIPGDGAGVVYRADVVRDDGGAVGTWRPRP